MNTSSNKALVIVLVVVVLLFLLFGGGALTGEMNGRMMNGVPDRYGWMNTRGWMRLPAIVTLCIGVVLGWVIFRKKN